MSNNQHFEQAEKRLRNGTINEVSRAGVEATLAVAYEQRTANLIAFYATIPSKLDADTQMLRSQILERLGL